MQRLLDHLEEAGFYSAKDLESISQTLNTMRETLDRGKNTHSPHLLTLLENRLEECQIVFDRLRKGLEPLSPELVKFHETLVSILRSTSAANTRSKVYTVCSNISEAIDLHDGGSFRRLRYLNCKND